MTKQSKLKIVTAGLSIVAAVLFAERSGSPEKLINSLSKLGIKANLKNPGQMLLAPQDVSRPDKGREGKQGKPKLS